MKAWFVKGWGKRLSRFDEVREQEEERAKHRMWPSALQMSWLVAILALAGVVGWLALSEPPAPSDGPKPSQTADVEPAPTAPVSMPEDEAEAAPDTDDAADTIGADQAAGPDPFAGLTGSPEEPGAEDAQREDAQAATPDPAQASGNSGDGLPLATEAALMEQTDAGPLPRIGPDGREPWQAYARPFDDFSTKPRIALVLTGLGLSNTVTRTAIETLPPEVTLSFSIYGNDLEGWIDQARGAGHEVMLMVPMEPYDYPENDPGPDTLRVDAEATDTLKTLRHILSRGTRYVGVTNDMGSKFTSSESAMSPFLEEMGQRGLLFLDARTSQYSVAARLAREMRVPRAVNNRYIDNDLNEGEILDRLEELENIARTYGAAAGVGRPYPVTIRTLVKWTEELESRGFVLAPLTAVANRQPVR